MPRKPKTMATDTNDILRDLLIVMLGQAGVKQHTIREIVGCDIVKVNRIVKHLKKKSPSEED